VATPLERLESEVLSLPEKERARLAQLILVSLDRNSFGDPNTLETAWVEENRAPRHRITGPDNSNYTG